MSTWTEECAAYVKRSADLADEIDVIIRALPAWRAENAGRLGAMTARLRVGDRAALAAIRSRLYAMDESRLLRCVDEAYARIIFRVEVLRGKAVLS